MTDPPATSVDVEPPPGICADCGLRPHPPERWRCAPCQAAHDADVAAKRSRRVPRPLIVP